MDTKFDPTAEVGEPKVVRCRQYGVGPHHPWERLSECLYFRDTDRVFRTAKCVLFIKLSSHRGSMYIHVRT